MPNYHDTVYLNDQLNAVRFFEEYYHYKHFAPPFNNSDFLSLLNLFKGDLIIKRINGWWFVEATVPSFEASAASEKYEAAVTVAIYKVLKKQQDVGYGNA